MGKKQWICKTPDPAIVSELQDRFEYPRLIAEILAGRGIEAEEVDTFVRAPLSGISDPYVIPGMRESAARLWQAVLNHEPVLIHGDYDTDGITATALMSIVLKQCGAVVQTFLPHRFDDGYGFTPESLKKSIESADIPPKVLVTVDCGVTSVEAVDAALEYGIDVIITDHHEPGEVLPRAMAVINPKVHPELSDLHLLSGVGMAFKLCHAFIKYGRAQKLGGFSVNLQEVLDLVALGTVADIVPLRGENRIMVKHGIRVLKRQQRPGIMALVELARLHSHIKPSDITFKLAPRLNAAGRLGSPETALQLLLADNIKEANDCARELERMNASRQQTEEDIYNQALGMIQTTINTDNCFTLVVAGEEWHQGVIGIVASRLARDYNRPAIVLTIHNDEAQGSGRSIGPLNLVKVLGECNPYLDRFGGHPMAVGLGMPRTMIPAFAQKFEEVVRREITLDDLEDRLELDCIATLDELHDPDLYRYFDDLAPFGHGNPQPVLLLKGVAVEKAFPISGGRHIRGAFIDENGTTIDFISFNTTAEEVPAGLIDVAVMPGLNDFYDLPKPQVQIVGWRAAE